MDIKKIAELILLQVDHNRECGKDDKFTLIEITAILRKNFFPNNVLCEEKSFVPCEHCNTFKMCKREGKCYVDYKNK